MVGIKIMHDEPDPVRTLTYDAVRGASAEAVRGNVSKIAFVSFLFNWPSSGGGNCHTAELGRLFKTYGYEVRHIFVRYEPWKIGDVAGPPPLDSMVLEFDEAGWQTENIQHRYRAALQEFDPDVVFVTDAWNFKPQLAEAAQEYPYFLRFDAQECLCPLNNIRLLPIGNGLLRQCHRHQFATYQACTECVGRFGSMMGDLHRKERALSGVGSEKYHVRLVASVSNAKAVLVVNPLIATMLEPYADYTLVIPPGVDAAEFSPSYCPRTHVGPIRILFAGIASDVLKGFHVLRNACNQLWQHRHDFELHVTSSPFGGSCALYAFCWVPEPSATACANGTGRPVRHPLSVPGIWSDCWY